MYCQGYDGCIRQRIGLNGRPERRVCARTEPSLRHTLVNDQFLPTMHGDAVYLLPTAPLCEETGRDHQDDLQDIARWSAEI